MDSVFGPAYPPDMSQIVEKRRPLSHQLLTPQQISDGRRGDMFTLFSRHYRDVTKASFASDLDRKHFVLLLQDGDALAGFTTAHESEFVFGDRVVSVIFSGDTIVDPAYWGEQELARAWLEQIGRRTREKPDREFFWFLIVKGHRTYRYLPAFALDFAPSRRGEQDGDLLALRNALAKDRFGEAFDEKTGVIRFDDARGRLDPALAIPSRRELALPDVAFFLEANPGYIEGDELACLCSLARENMRPRARRWFDAGFGATFEAGRHEP